MEKGPLKKALDAILNPNVFDFFVLAKLTQKKKKKRKKRKSKKNKLRKKFKKNN